MSSYKEPTTPVFLPYQATWNRWLDINTFILRLDVGWGWSIQSVIDKTVHFMIHPKIMTDQKQSGTKKPLLTHYRQQLMAHVVSSYAGCDLDIRCRSWECPSRSLLASHWSQRCFPGSWLAECPGKHFPSVGVGRALEMFYKANWCSLSCLHQMLGTTQTSFPADILRTSHNSANQRPVSSSVD